MTKLYAPSTNAVTQPWGAEFYNFNGVSYPQGFYRQKLGWYGHNGIDYSFGPDRNVYAAGDGVVTFADWGNKHPWVNEGGIVTMIDHGTFYTVYAHQYENDKIKVGQRVKAGQVIGTIGGTGMVAGPHLHFEVIPKNPNLRNGWYGRSKPVLVSDKPATVAPASVGDIMATLDNEDLEAIARAVWTYRNPRVEKKDDAYAILRGMPARVWGRTYKSPTNGKKYSMASYLINANVNSWKIPGVQRLVEKIASRNGIGQTELDAAVKEINDNTEAVLGDAIIDVDVSINGKEIK